MTSIETIKSEIISEFSLFEDWMEKYEYIIELGKSIPLIDPKFKIEDNLIKGCQSKVWIHAELKNKNVLFYADIVRLMQHIPVVRDLVCYYPNLNFVFA